MVQKVQSPGSRLITCFRFTQEERDLLKKVAAAKGVSGGEFVRQAIYEQAAQLDAA